MSDSFCWCCIPKAPRGPVVYPPRLRVMKLGPSDVDCDTPWYWAVWHHEKDRSGYSRTVTTRWGQTSRWEDAFDGGLVALARELGYEPVIVGRKPEPVVYVDEMGLIMVDRLDELVDRLGDEW